MTLTELRYIVALARERHFGRAAEACFVSQPTLSVAIRKLEEELGVTLFERGKGEITPTPVGERVVTQAQRVLEDTEAIRGIARQGQDQLKGPLRLGAILTIGPYLLPHLIPILHERAPEMPLIIEEGFTTTLRDRLKSGELDVIVLSLPFSEHGLMVQPVYDEPFVALLPESHPLAARDPVETDALATDNLLLLGAGNCFRDQVLQVCPACNRSAGLGDGMQGTLEASSLETIRHMIASGMGVTMVPCTAAPADQYSSRLLAIRRLSEPTPQRRVAVAWRKSFPRPEAVALVRDAILDCQLSCVTMLDMPPQGGESD